MKGRRHSIQNNLKKRILTEVTGKDFKTFHENTNHMLGIKYMCITRYFYLFNLGIEQLNNHVEKCCSLWYYIYIT